MKQIIDYPNYVCSKNGEIYNILTGRLLKERIISSGYKSVLLSNGVNKKEFLIHRLVALNYVPIKRGQNFVNHKDLNKLNNNVENLEWCIHKENIKHAYKAKNWNQNGQRKRKVINIETGQIYDSVKMAAQVLNVKYINLYMNILKKKNFHLKFFN